MRLYKPTYTDRDGKRCKTSRWYVEFADPRETTRRVRRIPAFTSRPASEEFGRNLRKLLDARAGGGIPELSIRQWLQGLQPATRKTLHRLGFLKGIVEGQIKSHVSDYQKSMEGDARAPRHIAWTISQIQKVIDGCGFINLSDIAPEPVKAFISTLAAGEDGIKTRSFNGYVTAFKSFTNWAVKDGRLPYSPLATLHKRKQTDEKERRALTLDEARMLLAITELAVDRFGMTGPERALVYRLSMETGLRAGELHSLRRSSFELAGEEPIVKIAAGSAKNRKADRIHLNASTTAALAIHLENKLPAAPAFNMPDSTHTAEMFRDDCADARLAWIAAAPEGRERIDRASGSFLADEDDAGRVLVFHSLRHTRGVWLFEHFGASAKEVQQLMRLSSIALVDKYSKSFKVGGKNFAKRSPDLSTDQSPDIAAAVQHGSNEAAQTG